MLDGLKISVTSEKVNSLSKLLSNRFTIRLARDVSISMFKALKARLTLLKQKLSPSLTAGSKRRMATLLLNSLHLKINRSLHFSSCESHSARPFSRSIKNSSSKPSPGELLIPLRSSVCRHCLLRSAF